MLSLETRILVVDDAQSIRQMVVKHLQDLGYIHISEAEDGDKAFNMLATAATPFGLILSDWDMPNCDGLMLLKMVRANPDTAKLPFILITAKNEMNKTVEAVKAGVTNYIVKPFTLDTLKDKLAKVR